MIQTPSKPTDLEQNERPTIGFQDNFDKLHQGTGSHGASRTHHRHITNYPSSARDLLDFSWGSAENDHMIRPFAKNQSKPCDNQFQSDFANSYAIRVLWAMWLNSVAHRDLLDAHASQCYRKMREEWTHHSAPSQQYDVASEVFALAAEFDWLETSHACCT